MTAFSEQDRINLSSLSWFKINLEWGEDKEHIIAQIPLNDMLRKTLFLALKNAEIADCKFAGKDGAVTLTSVVNLPKRREDNLHILLNPEDAKKLADLGVEGPVFNSLKERRPATAPENVRS